MGCYHWWISKQLALLKVCYYCDNDRVPGCDGIKLTRLRSSRLVWTQFVKGRPAVIVECICELQIDSNKVIGFVVSG